MKKYLILLLVVCSTLVGCNVKDNAVKGQIDRIGLITEVDVSGNRVLVDDPDKGLIWLTLSSHGDITKYEVNQEVVVWIEGGVKESYPAQATARNIEILGAEELSFHEFYFSKHEFPPNLAGFIDIDSARFNMEKGGFRWTKGNQTTTTDAAGPTQIAENFEAIFAEANSKAKIVIEQNPSLSVYAWNAKREEIAVEEGLISLPATSGRYIYEVVAEWTNGEVSFTFVVEVK
ncbi:DUF3221 domain-containing protein [Sporosarcina sp. YIM B06819]|uniref:DUF3221 domain-containing protein n=1 Tax=Sporosarcina sp. YIM B06819 TaxID=3081769 RepID=UPI00298D0FF2|nr:DUF3221 domain-containing protein [Sporosarcina sp. YIM B06819]